MRTEKRSIAQRLCLGLFAVLLVAPIVARAESSATRQQEIVKKGANVMPFDLARTTHYFDDTASGGIETVTANDPADMTQIALIRAHLASEEKRFARGDFSDPAKIHGRDMPGLAKLETAGGKLRVSYKDLPAGASLTYASRDQATIAAIHEWFAAQRNDHEAHAHMHK
jgi:hypothetical protein